MDNKIYDHVSNDWVLTEEQDKYVSELPLEHQIILGMYFADKRQPMAIGNKFKMKASAVGYVVFKYREKFELDFNRFYRKRAI